MRVDIESGKYTYIFEDGRARLLRYGEPTSRDVVGDKLIYCMAAEISELRQQLAERDEQISDLTVSSDTYFAERNSARDVWRRASKDRDELRQQLAAAHELIRLIFESTPPYREDDTCVFSDAVIKKWKELLP